MKFLRVHNKICSVMAAVVVASLIMYSYGSFRSYAASPEVSTLPADIDIDVEYTADTVSFAYAGNTYSIDRKYNVNLIHYSYKSSSGRYTRDYNQPETFELSFGGELCYASYWFSPSEMRVYVLMTPALRKVSQVKSYIASSNYGTFLLVDGRYSLSNFNSVFLTTIDYISGSAIYNVMSSQEAISYWDAESSDTKSYDDIYACSANTNYFNYYRIGYYEGGTALRRAYLGYQATGELNTSDYASYYHYIPSDLLCIFSNYEISGFYEPDNSKINTPDYYFNYQYIFYKEGYGYIFVDSAKRCKEVGFPNGVTNPRFYFDGEGNNYVYTSVDGITWILKSAYNTMYNSYFEVSCGYAFTDYTLVYTNDKNFGGDPLVAPKWDSFDDNVMKDILDESSGSLFHDDGYDYGKYSTVMPWSCYVTQFAYQLDSAIGCGAMYDYFFGNRFNNSDDPVSWEDYFSLFIMTELSSDYIVNYETGDGTLTLFGYVKRLNELIENNNIYLSSMLERADSRLKSIYQNITLSNQFLKRISDNFDSLSIPAAAPDYSGDFDKLSSALDKLHHDLIYEEGVTTLPNVSQYLVQIYWVSSDIRTRLDTMISQLPGSVEVDTDSVVTAVEDMQSAISDKLDSVIAKIPTSAGGGSFDDSNMVGSIAALKSDISGNFETLIKLLKNDVDGVEGIQDLTSFITSYVVSMGNAAYFTTLLDFADGVKNNVSLINETMVTMVSDSGIFAPIFTLGAGFAVFSGLIRKERMN